MIRRPSDAWIPPLLEMYRNLARLPSPIISIDPRPYPGHEEDFRSLPTKQARESPLIRACSTGADYTGTLAQTEWLRQGPKIVDVSEEQYRALSQIEVRLEVKDLQMPYPALLVNMPPGHMHAYVVLYRHVAHDTPILIGCSISSCHRFDIVTVARHKDGHTIDQSLGKFHDPIITPEEGQEAYRALRVAVNMALAMTNFGCQAQYLFPSEVERDQKSVQKGIKDKAERARQRLSEAPMLVTLDRTVQLYHREGSHLEGDPTGRTLPFHWRRGHWRKTHAGKIVFVRPCMVRSDLMTTPPEDTTTTYQ